MSGKLIFRIAVNTAIGVALIFIWSRFVDLDNIGRIIKTIDLKVVIFLLIFFVLSGVLKSYRLNILLDKKVAFKDLVALNYLSQLLSFMIPLRVGEITKGVYLSSQLNINFAKAVVWVFVDRFLDFWAVLLLITTLIYIVPSSLPGASIKLIWLFFAIFNLLAMLAIFGQGILTKMVYLFSKILIINTLKSRFIKLSINIIEGLQLLRKPPLQLIAVAFLTILALIVDGFAWMFIFLSIGLKIDVFTAVLGNALSALTFLIPSAPGYVGSAEAALLVVFSGILKMDPDMVSAGVVVFHVLTILALLLLGFSSLYFLKFDLKIVWARIKGRS